MNRPDHPYIIFYFTDTCLCCGRPRKDHIGEATVDDFADKVNEWDSYSTILLMCGPCLIIAAAMLFVAAVT